MERTDLLVAIGNTTVCCSAAFLMIAAAQSPGTTPGWFEISKALLPVAATIVIGCLAAWVANGQRVISRGQAQIADAQREIAASQRDVAAGKLRLDLFEKRFEIFQVVWGLLSHPKVIDGPALTPASFQNLMPKAEFLFGSTIREYMLEIIRERSAFQSIYARARRNENVLVPNDIAEHTRLQAWFFNEASDGCRRRFGPFLDFSVWC